MGSCVNLDNEIGQVQGIQDENMTKAASIDEESEAMMRFDSIFQPEIAAGTGLKPTRRIRSWTSGWTGCGGHPV